MKIKQILAGSFFCMVFANLAQEIENPKDKLFRGVANQDLELVMDAFDRGANMNAIDEHGNTALQALVRSCDSQNRCIEIARFLLNANADPNIQDKDGNTALAYFIKNRFDAPELVKGLATHTDLNIQNNTGDTALDIARKKDYPISATYDQILQGQREKQKQRIKKEVSELTPLPLFSRMADIVSEYTVYPKWSTQELTRQFFIGIRINNRGSVQDALDSGVDINVKDIRGDTALIISINNDKNDIDMAKLLLNSNADPNIQNNDGDTALMKAVAWNKSNIIKDLLNSKADPNIQNKSGNTALMKAVAQNKANIVSLLLSSEVDLNLTNNYDYTALDIAKEYGLNTIEKMLKDYQIKQKQRVKDRVAKLTPLLPDIADIVSEYVVNPKESKIEIQE